MFSLSDVTREMHFLSKQRYVLVLLSAVFALAIFSVWTGIAEIHEQRKTIQRLLEKDELDRSNVLAQKKDYGNAAYYSFHLTYSPPEALAFAASGQRDIYPWKHRIRMLALEGQIYETDAANPELSFLGRFDYAFLISVLLPLFVILLLHDMRSSEREAGRYDLLIVTTSGQHKLWTARALALCLTLLALVALPFAIASFIMQVGLASSLFIILITAGHLLFWAGLTLLLGNVMAKHRQSSARIASALLGVWLLLSVIVPVVSDSMINRSVQSPNGGEIVLTQREAVNDAWDLPFSTTWEAFLSTHPQWSEHTKMTSLFAWKWYYAFQQVGDQKAAELSKAYRTAMVHKDSLAAKVAILSPPMLVQRQMTSAAKTDVKAYLAYEQRVRDFHASLREFYYPLVFHKVKFEHKTMEGLPEFSPSSRQE